MIIKKLYNFIKLSALPVLNTYISPIPCPTKVSMPIKLEFINFYRLIFSISIYILKIILENIDNIFEIIMIILDYFIGVFIRRNYFHYTGIYYNKKKYPILRVFLNNPIDLIYIILCYSVSIIRIFKDFLNKLIRELIIKYQIT